MKCWWTVEPGGLTAHKADDGGSLNMIAKWVRLGSTSGMSWKIRPAALRGAKEKIRSVLAAGLSRCKSKSASSSEDELIWSSTRVISEGRINSYNWAQAAGIWLDVSQMTESFCRPDRPIKGGPSTFMDCWITRKNPRSGLWRTEATSRNKSFGPEERRLSL